MKKKIAIILMALMIMGFLVGCSTTESVDKVQRQQTEEIMQEINRQIGMPNIHNFYEKKLAKDIFELRDDANLITYVYTQSMDGKFIYIGKGIGFGLPYSVQYTNPERIAWSSSQGGAATLPQADPNGLFMPDGLSATWIILINEETGEREVMYTEPNLVVTQSKLPRRLVASWSLPSDY